MKLTQQERAAFEKARRNGYGETIGRLSAALEESTLTRHELAVWLAGSVFRTADDNEAAALERIYRLINMAAAINEEEDLA